VHEWKEMRRALKKKNVLRRCILPGDANANSGREEKAKQRKESRAFHRILKFSVGIICRKRTFLKKIVITNVASSLFDLCA